MGKKGLSLCTRNLVNDLVPMDIALVVVEDDPCGTILPQDDPRADKMVGGAVLALEGLGADDGGAGLTLMVEVRPHGMDSHLMVVTVEQIIGLDVIPHQL